MILSQVYVCNEMMGKSSRCKFSIELNNKKTKVLVMCMILFLVKSYWSCYCNQDEASGWKEDLLTPRQSALNLLSLIATAKVWYFHPKDKILPHTLHLIGYEALD